MTFIHFSKSQYLRSFPIIPTYPSNATKYDPRAKLKPIFTDNSRVVYKPKSLAPGGVGTVRNHFMKARKT